MHNCQIGFESLSAAELGLGWNRRYWVEKHPDEPLIRDFASGGDRGGKPGPRESEGLALIATV